jgi:hypothetical protein
VPKGLGSVARSRSIASELQENADIPDHRCDEGRRLSGPVLLAIGNGTRVPHSLMCHVQMSASIIVETFTWTPAAADRPHRSRVPCGPCRRGAEDLVNPRSSTTHEQSGHAPGRPVGARSGGPAVDLVDSRVRLPRIDPSRVEGRLANDCRGRALARSHPGPTGGRRGHPRSPVKPVQL